jgi:hypothetical protein
MIFGSKELMAHPPETPSRAHRTEKGAEFLNTLQHMSENLVAKLLFKIATSGRRSLAFFCVSIEELHIDKYAVESHTETPIPYRESDEITLLSRRL